MILDSQCVSASASSTSEWLKTLFTALAAFTVGLLSEPLKIVINSRFKLRNMRRSLYTELAHVYGHLSMFLREEARPFHDFVLFLETETLPTDVYRWAKSQLDVFYQLTEAGSVDNVYRNLQWALADEQENADADEFHLRQRFLIAMVIFEKNALLGDLNLPALRAANRKVFNTLMKVQSGREVSAERLLQALQSAHGSVNITSSEVEEARSHDET